jgi:polysaccharide biosynthesis protein PslH
MSTDLRILLLTHGTPFPVRSGGQMYTANVIRTLSGRDDIDLTVLAIGTADSVEHAPAGASWHMSLPPSGSGTLGALVGKYPRAVAATISGEYRRRIRALLTASTWDAVVIDYIAIGWILDDVVTLTSRHQTRIVYLSHNVESTLRKRIAEGYAGPAPLRWVALRDAQKAARLEEDMVRSADLVTAETEEDAAEFRSLFKAGRVHVYPPGYDGHVVESRPIPLTDTRRAVAVIGSRSATMKRLVLDDLLRSVAPRLDELGIGIVVAGEAPHKYLESRAEQYPSVEFHGYVADLVPLLASVRLGLITDHIGGGFKHRILTLVFNRVPIVATREAMAGLPLKPGIHYVDVAGNNEASDVIAKVTDDFDRLESIQRAAFEACAPVFDWSASTDAFVAALCAMPVES